MTETSSCSRRTSSRIHLARGQPFSRRASRTPVSARAGQVSEGWAVRPPNHTTTTAAAAGATATPLSLPFPDRSLQTRMFQISRVTTMAMCMVADLVAPPDACGAKTKKFPGLSPAFRRTQRSRFRCGTGHWSPGIRKLAMYTSTALLYGLRCAHRE